MSRAAFHRRSVGGDTRAAGGGGDVRLVEFDQLLELAVEHQRVGLGQRALVDVALSVVAQRGTDPADGAPQPAPVAVGRQVDLDALRHDDRRTLEHVARRAADWNCSLAAHSGHRDRHAVVGDFHLDLLTRQRKKNVKSFPSPYGRR